MKEEMKILIWGIQFFLDHPQSNYCAGGLSDCCVLRRINGAGIESANVYRVKDGRPDKLVVFQGFKQGDVTIADKDPAWKEHLLEAAGK